jgi:hypothetical protein
MLSTDSRGAVDESNLPDARVRHYWDGEREVGRWLAARDLGGLGYPGIVWDAFFFFGPDARWDDVPAPLAASGTTVVGQSGRLAEAAARTFG